MRSDRRYIDWATDPRASTGEWSAPVAYPNAGVIQHAVLIPGTSNILYFEDGNGTFVLNPNVPAISFAGSVPNNLFCAGQTVLADGRIMTLGGDLNGQPEVGSVSTNIYTPGINTWSPTAPMHFLRWYPTATKLPDGRILATSGTASGVTQLVPEIYSPPTNTWTTVPSASHYFPSYPFMFVVPDGRIVQVGSFVAPTNVQILNPSSWTWSTVDGRVTDAGSATMYRPGKILRAGSSGFPGTAAQVSSAAAYTLDMTSPAPALQPTSSMALPRAFLNLTTLPDGNVLATGGERNHDIANGANATLPAEEWSPATGQWTTLASNRVPRYYHSVAVLLPDGRVVVGGGWGGNGSPNDRQRSYEIFSPPYLFKGARPSILGGPGAAGYGTAFTLGVPNASDIASVVLIPPAAVTHDFDENQRFVPLGFNVIPGGLQVAAPPNANYAPPGPYMLWIVNKNGVPSVAHWINID